MTQQPNNLPAPVKPIPVKVRRVEQPQIRWTPHTVWMFNRLPPEVARAWGVRKGGEQ